MKNNKINIKEFREKGYLQEANRRFFHPLGLALSVACIYNNNKHFKKIRMFLYLIEKAFKVLTSKNKDPYFLDIVQDNRNDSKGFIFDISNESNEQKIKMYNKKIFIDNELLKRKEPRIKFIGNIIEPIK
jgi:hypothetical protein